MNLLPLDCFAACNTHARVLSGSATHSDGASSVVTCAKREGNLYHEHQDAQTLAEWGVDYWKYDACGEDNLQAFAKFTVMRDALNRTGRPMVYSFEPHGSASYNPVAWPALTGNSWRTGHDIGDGYGSVMGSLAKANAWANVGGPGGFNDADSELFNTEPSWGLVHK